MAISSGISSRLLCYIDGASRGNPGPSAIGVVFYAPEVGSLDGDGNASEPIVEWGAGLGCATNNIAEYQALLSALGKALDLGVRHLVVRSDSELLVRQMNGQYKVRQPHLKVLHGQAKQLESGFGRVVYEHIPRAQNARADRLANQALDAKTGS
jgi:ribonuclease HI